MDDMIDETLLFKISCVILEKNLGSVKKIVIWWFGCCKAGSDSLHVCIWL